MWLMSLVSVLWVSPGNPVKPLHTQMKWKKKTGLQEKKKKKALQTTTSFVYSHIILSESPLCTFVEVKKKKKIEAWLYYLVLL